MSTTYPYILFFIDGPNPSFDEQLERDKLSPCKVAFRNARHIATVGALEKCDGVTGEHVPARYKEAYPEAEEAIEAFVRKREEAFKLAEERKQMTAEERADAQAKDALAAQKKAQEEVEKAAAKAQAAEKDAEKANAKAKETKDGKKEKLDKSKVGAGWKPNS